MNQELKTKQTKELITDHAFKLFYENGFKATSIDKIMKSTQLSKGAFYHHYKNKQEIGLEVIEQKIEQRVYNGMIEPLLETGNASDILKDTFVNRIKHFPFYDKKHGCPMNNFINEIGDYEKPYQTALKSIIEKWRIALVNILERGKVENTFRKNISSKAVAVYLISAFEGIRGIRKLYNDDEILNEYLSELSVYLKQLEN